ncbi:MAG: riboflavin biosynthesis protein RibD [Alphaproteobacteria bacterium CG_4_9_14_3_um_filter_47_13]|nr:MAG: riboflavin biosynthesis protein RibD [Alphaproteobacteria bacterium CG_4_9_14_3_um_filter_47_13]
MIEQELSPVKVYDRDFHYMQLALDLAAQGLGRVAPNPSVGCVIVKDGVIVGQARSADGGRPHAETQALAQAGVRAAGADIYTTLEPCGHYGVTPPCVEALIKAKAGRVIIACHDPNQSQHHCMERLQAAGIIVTQGICEAEALVLNEGFFNVITKQRPLVTAKIATTLDGKIATSSGKSKWITGDSARRKVHEIRAVHDAILVGVGTVLADDPQLTVRLENYNNDPVRIIIDCDLKTPMTSQILQKGAADKTWFLCGSHVTEDRRDDFRNMGAKLVSLESRSGFFAPDVLLKELAKQGITRLFIEGGGVTLTGFLKAGLVDRLYWFRAPKLVGADGMNAIQPLGIYEIEEAIDLELEQRIMLDKDILEVWRLERQ